MRGMAVLAIALLAALPALGQKRRVAVLNFDYATVQSDVRAIFGMNQDVGKGIADLLVTQLVNGNNYTVVERKALDKIIAEQNFSNSDRADSATAARIGKLLGVEGIIIGSITQFGRDDKTTSVGGGVLGRESPRLRSPGFGVLYGGGILWVGASKSTGAERLRNKTEKEHR